MMLPLLAAVNQGQHHILTILIASSKMQTLSPERVLGGIFREKPRFEKQDTSTAPSGAYKCFAQQNLGTGRIHFALCLSNYPRIPKRKDTQSVSFLFGGDTQI